MGTLTTSVFSELTSAINFLDTRHTNATFSNRKTTFVTLFWEFFRWSKWYKCKLHNFTYSSHKTKSVNGTFVTLRVLDTRKQLRINFWETDKCLISRNARIPNERAKWLYSFFIPEFLIIFHFYRQFECHCKSLMYINVIFIHKRLVNVHTLQLPIPDFKQASPWYYII